MPVCMISDMVIDHCQEVRDAYGEYDSCGSAGEVQG